LYKDTERQTKGENMNWQNSGKWQSE